MEWTQDLSVGVEQIDSQHKELIARVNSFYDVMSGAEKNAKVLEVLNFLESYVISRITILAIRRIKSCMRSSRLPLETCARR